MSQSLAGALEETVLAGLVWNSELSSSIAMRVPAELFTTRHYRTIARAAIDHVVKYGEPPRNHLADLIEDDLNRAETGKVLWSALSRLEIIQAEMQPNYVMSELNSFIESHKLAKALAISSDHLHKGELLKAKEALLQLDVVADDPSPGIWLNDPTQAFRFMDHSEEEETFSLGIEALDSRGIRPKRKSLFVILAPKKRGKSMALIQIGREAVVFNHQKVLHITLEMSDEEIAQRYIQSICNWTAGEWKEHSMSVPLFKRDTMGQYLGIEFDTQTRENLNQNTRKEAAEKLKSRMRGGRKLLIKEFPTSKLTMARLVMYLEYLKRVEKFEPDLLIVDYANLMAMDSTQTRFETGRIFRELRGIGVERNMAVVTATQGNRISETAKIVGATHLAEDWSSAGTADILVAICRTPQEKEKRLARIFVAAARRAPDEFLVMITQNYECCQFAVDSIYMNKAASTDVNKMMQGDDDD